VLARSSALVLLVPGALSAWLAFRDGGAFPDSVAGSVVVVLALLLLLAVLAAQPFAAPSPGLVVVVAAGAGLAAWTLLSSQWSDSASRAMLAYVAVLLYVGMLVLGALAGRSDDRARILLYGLLAGAAVASVAALAAWLLPETFPVAGDSRLRLAWPTSYWNATALLAGLGVIWATHLSCALHEPLAARVLGAALVPLLVPVMVFAVSRGAAAVTVLGLAVFVVAARHRGLLTGLVAVAPGAALAIALALGTDGLDAEHPAQAALDDGRRLALVLGACALGTALLRALLGLVDRRLRGWQAPRVAPRAQWAMASGAAVLAVAVVLAAGVPGRIADVVHDFAADSAVSSTLDPRERFTKLSSNGRLDHWRVALDHGFEPHRVRGTGAGTYALLWARDRPSNASVQNAHSLYLEVLGELGLVGLALVVVLVGGMLLALAWRCRRAERLVWAPLLAGAVAWAVHAGVDWDWQMPAVTLGAFAAGGLALARPVPAAGAAPARRPLRLAVGLGCLALAVLPVSVFRSQRALDRGVAAFRAGDCAQATDGVLDAADALAARPEPYEVLAWCDARRGRLEPALRAIGEAVERDPGNWEFRYDEALIRAVARLDPRPAARAALARNPRDPYARGINEAFRRARRSTWRRLALRAPLPINVS
jgi:hypothetical protein